MTDVTHFDLQGVLPHGRLAIEASAGTGKTFTLSTLAARYVAEDGVAISELLVVTFTRAAAAELKDRIRARLVQFAHALAADDAPDDPLLHQVWQTDRALRLARVQRAVTEFDSASITTIHGFAQQVLGTLGTSVPTDPDAVLVDDSGVLLRNVVTDLLVAEAVNGVHPIDTVPTYTPLLEAAQLALGNPDAALVPSTDPADSDPAAALIRALVDETVQRIDARRRHIGSLSFDDLLVQLRRAVEGPGGDTGRHALRSRFRVALIDEFQDTDPVQWAIFDSVFGHDAADGGGPETVLVLVGDPKQAIYAFRGANVHTYLQAAHDPGTARAGLAVNWRSDPDMLRAIEVLLTGATFGDERIGFQPVTAPETNRSRVLRSVDGTSMPALSLRLTDGPGVPRQKVKSKTHLAKVDTDAVFAELAVYIRDLLDTMEIPDEDGHDEHRRLRPDDIAVLLTANADGPQVRNALGALGIPAVISRGDNVLTSEASTHWHRLLAALARPTDLRRARAAAITWFFDWDANHLADADDHDVTALQEQLHQWGEHLSAHGVAAFVGRVRAETGVAARVLGLHDGDRAMTDLDHVAELLCLSAGRHASPATLLTTFEQLSGGNDDGDPEADLAARRVESEARAVQIMTTFVAKGLEYPVVCCPTLWKSRGAEADANIWWDDVAGKRTIDVATKLRWGPDEQRAEREAASTREAVGTNLRVLYVALTRARHHTAVWWLPTEKAGITGLGRVLFARDDDGAIDPVLFAEPVTSRSGQEALDCLAPLVDRGGGCIEVVSVDKPPRQQERWTGADEPEPLTFEVATLDHELDRARSRWSFTAITARTNDHLADWRDPFDDTEGDAGSADEGTEPGGADGPATQRGGATNPAELPLGDIPGGAGFGTLVHEVLERVDFTAADLEAEIATSVAERLAWNPWPVDARQLVDGLVAVVRTPLGPLFAGQALVDLAPADRLDELSFDLTLGEAGVRATDADVGRLLLTHLPTGDPLGDWAERLAGGLFSTVLAGHLTGSIDLVARVRHADGIDRFVVSDYKTNRLAPRGVLPTAEHFRPGHLPDAMAEHHYPLQALLYSVALHRYLRWRLPDYDPAVHLGGVGYLFVRGMVGPGTPTTDGVPDGLFDWRPSADLINALSDLLDGQGAPAARR